MCGFVSFFPSQSLARYRTSAQVTSLRWAVSPELTSSLGSTFSELRHSPYGRRQVVTYRVGRRNEAGGAEVTPALSHDDSATVCRSLCLYTAPADEGEDPEILGEYHAKRQAEGCSPGDNGTCIPRRYWGSPPWCRSLIDRASNRASSANDTASSTQSHSRVSIMSRAVQPHRHAVRSPVRTRKFGVSVLCVPLTRPRVSDHRKSRRAAVQQEKRGIRGCGRHPGSPSHVLAQPCQGPA